ncbi:MAG: phage holin family protein [Bacillota bacterium]
MDHLRWLIQWLLNSLALLLVDALLEGIDLQGIGTALLAAVLLGLINTFIRPLLVILALPLTVLTFGLFILIINALTFALTAWLLPGFTVSGPLAAFWGALLMSLFSWGLNLLFNRK